MSVDTEPVDFDELEFSLLESEWVEAEFAAIMIASGFGDRVIAGVCDQPRSELPQDTPVIPRSPLRSRSRDAAARSSARSPPHR